MLAGILMVVGGLGAEKVCITVLAAQMKMKLYGLIWVPVYGLWMESTVVYRLVGRKEWVRIILFLLKLIIPVLLIAAYVVSDDVYGDASFNAVYYSVLFVLAIYFVFRGIMYTIAMRRLGFNTFISIIVSFFVQPFWSCFLMSSVKRIVNSGGTF
ncbi:MAG: hypothetical protein MJ094_08205 [Saccharofermentans sp.]|nr:hypothetical protein [Saccharofermentans sp.]